uniref:Uncharacterized protein n=1 Tax=Steinernema glaseri TaxID=37863 RepID=A0A1I8ARM9_9BILA
MVGYRTVTKQHDYRTRKDVSVYKAAQGATKKAYCSSSLSASGGNMNFVYKKKPTRLMTPSGLRVGRKRAPLQGQTHACQRQSDRPKRLKLLSGFGMCRRKAAPDANTKTAEARSALKLSRVAIKLCLCSRLLWCRVHCNEPRGGSDDSGDRVHRTEDVRTPRASSESATVSIPPKWSKSVRLGSSHTCQRRLEG